MKNQNIFFYYSENQKNLDTYILNEVCKGKKIKTFFIDGKKCINEQVLYKEFSKVLSFPGYFGKNWDALEECINDLDWLQEKEIIVVILDCDKLLQPISEEKDRQIFWDIIKKNIEMSPKEKYSNPANADEPRTIFVLQSSDQKFLNHMFQYMAE